MPTNTTSPETEDNTELLNEEEDYSSGNGRLAIIVGAILLLAIIGYMFLPGSGGRRIITTVMPSVMLGEASVTGSRTAAEPAPAAASAEKTTEETAAPAAAAEEAAKPAVVRPAAEEGLATRATANVMPAAEPAAPAEAAAAPAPAAEPAAAPATVTLSGRILDENGRPLAGATVLVKGSRLGTGTDANGNYKLEVPAGETALVYGYGGYEDQEVRARGSQPVNVTLIPSETGKRRRR